VLGWLEVVLLGDLDLRLVSSPHFAKNDIFKNEMMMHGCHQVQHNTGQ
jgi:hypothetical protein